MKEYIVFEPLTVSDLRTALNRYAETGWTYRGDVSVRESSEADAHPAIIMGRETQSGLSVADSTRVTKEESGGLTIDELETMNHLIQAWNWFLELPDSVGSADDLTQFRQAIHSAQQILGQRVLRREYPDYWG